MLPGLLAKVFSKVLVQLPIVCACRHVEAIVPLWNIVAPLGSLRLNLLLLFAGRFRATLNLVVHHLRLVSGFSVSHLLLSVVILLLRDAIIVITRLLLVNLFAGLAWLGAIHNLLVLRQVVRIAAMRLGQHSHFLLLIFRGTERCLSLGRLSHFSNDLRED